MERYLEHLATLKALLTRHPGGLTILDIAAHLGINRNSVAKYLEVLRIGGHLDVRSVGPAKLYRLSHRLPTKALLDHSSEAILVLDEHRIVQANEEAARLLRREQESLPGAEKGILPFLDENRLGRVLAGRKSSFDFTLGRRAYHATMLPTTFDDGSPGATMIIEEVTRRRETEERLRLLERAVEASSGAITIADMRQEDRPLIYVNPAFERMTGYAKEEVLGRNCRFLQADDRDQEAIALITEALERGQECTVELRNYRKDGTSFWNRLHLAPVTDDQGAHVYLIQMEEGVI